MHRMHARAFAPPEGFDLATYEAEQLQGGSPPEERVVEGWEVWLDASGPDEPLLEARPAVTCARCRASPECAERTRCAGREAAAARPGLSHLVRMALLGADSENPQLAKESRPLWAEPAFAWGPSFREVCAGKATITKAAQEMGLPTGPPVELYGDPDRRTDPNPDNDLREPRVHERLLLEAGELPGPEVCNVWVWETVCAVL